jgi:peptidase E
MVMNVNIIAGDRRKDSFMHAADMFESFKRYGEKFCIEYEKGNLDQEFIVKLKDLFEKNGYVVTALWLAEDPKVHYVDWNVKLVSNGKTFFVLEECLNQFGVYQSS